MCSYSVRVAKIKSKLDGKASGCAIGLIGEIEGIGKVKGMQKIEF